MKAIYAGSFDPLTLGHLDIIQRASLIFENLLILVSENPEKASRIPTDQRINLIEEATSELTNIEVDSFTGLTVQHAREKGYDLLLRGMRGAADFETELEMSQINRALSDGLETVFLMTSPNYSFIRSSRVWELMQYGGDLTHLVPANVKNYLQKANLVLK